MTKTDKVFYFSLFNDMAEYIRSTEEFQMWVMMNNVPWEQDMLVDGKPVMRPAYDMVDQFFKDKELAQKE